MTGYEQFLSGLSLSHFSPAEISYRGASNLDLQLNTEPPRHLWRNMVRPLWLADMARSTLGGRIRILSAYRNSQYNAAIGGASASQHVQNRALDLDPLDQTPEELFNLLWGWRSRGVFMGGLGLYPSFVHVDTRGKNANWGMV